ncbi:MAG: hypothetical protein HQL84_11190 [Magnetococcales bacterium]|nr:hypothetical protein [Magnetococcales bacterium]MBF0150598.1 hypothetical protein [Magnetococcales bacterium]MBF0348255.1 hypothetical protein [Magnetococcales bacterium]MBF0629384.1 hypothetical protein [Magnetococcales bacterium]
MSWASWWEPLILTVVLCVTLVFIGRRLWRLFFSVQASGCGCAEKSSCLSCVPEEMIKKKKGS